MRKCKQVHFIHGDSLDDLECKMNGALVEGAEFGGVDITTLTGIIVVTEYVGEIKKTALDELEDELGRHNCAECPFFEESTDRRKKWHSCSKHGKKVQKTSSCCIAYYELLREEVESEISEDKGENEGVRREGRGYGSLVKGVTASRIRPAEREVKVPTLGMRIPRSIFRDTERRVV